MILDRLNEKFNKYKFELISEDNIDEVLLIMRTNTYFYSVTQDHVTTREECVDDIATIPPGIDSDMKTYVMICHKDKAIGIIDFVEGYPNDNMAYIGFFMIDGSMQGSGIGSKLFFGIVEIARDIGLVALELACYENNKRGLDFWKKMKFVEIRKSMREVDGKVLALISLKRDIYYN